MAAGNVVYARFPITIDSSAVADISVTTAFLTSIFPILTYDILHTELVFDTGSKTKATVVIIAQSIA